MGTNPHFRGGTGNANRQTALGADMLYADDFPADGAGGTAPGIRHADDADDPIRDSGGNGDRHGDFREERRRAPGSRVHHEADDGAAGAGGARPGRNRADGQCANQSACGGNEGFAGPLRCQRRLSAGRPAAHDHHGVRKRLRRRAVRIHCRERGEFR